MFDTYEVVECLKTDHPTHTAYVERPAIWFRIRDKTLGTTLPGGFESQEEAQACCDDLNKDRP